MSLMGIYIYDRCLSNRFEYDVVILNIGVSNIQFDTFRSLVEKEEREREGKKEVQSNLHIITFFRSVCHLYESEPFFFRLARVDIRMYIVLNYVSIDRTLLYYIYIC